MYRGSSHLPKPWEQLSVVSFQLSDRSEESLKSEPGVGGDVWSLEVFRRAYALSLDLHWASQGFPKFEQYGGVADQLRRASKSVCALLAEGSGRQASSDAEFRRYIVMRWVRWRRRSCGARMRATSASLRRRVPAPGRMAMTRSRACCAVCCVICENQELRTTV
jgi:hypothetical protein